MPVMMCFIDQAKVFDCVKWKKLYKVLSEMGVPSHIVDLVESLYELDSMEMRVDGEESEI